MQQKPRLVVVSNRLPVTVERRQEDGTSVLHYQLSSGGLVSALMGLQKNYSFLWVGWPGIIPRGQAEQADIQTTLLERHNCIPVFLEEDVADLYGNIFCNRILWPILHYQTKNIEFSGDAWNAYRRANEIFAQQLATLVQDGDIVWIHDYHLMLLASNLKAACKLSVQVGFFLHTPFPSAEVFQIVPRAKELLQGMLANDMIAFHTYDYLRHFISNCTLHLGAFSMGDSVLWKGRNISVQVIPIGIEPATFIQGSRSPRVQEIVARIKNENAGKIILLGVERLDYIKGVQNKLLAFEKLLQSYPVYIGKVVFIEIAVPSRTSVEEYRALRSEVNEIIGHVNGTFGGISYIPIHYINRSIAPEDLMALYAVADVCVVTSNRDGMNLVAFEYVASRENNPGALVLSEFAGASHSLDGSLIVNPWNIAELADAYHEAINLPNELKKLNFQKMFNYVSKQTSTRWGETFVLKLWQTQKESKHLGLNDLLQFAGNIQLAEESFKDEEFCSHSNSNEEILQQSKHDLTNSFQLDKRALLDSLDEGMTLLVFDMNHLVSSIGELASLQLLHEIEQRKKCAYVFLDNSSLDYQNMAEVLTTVKFIVKESANASNDGLFPLQHCSWKDAVKSLIGWYKQRFCTEILYNEEPTRICITQLLVESTSSSDAIALQCNEFNRNLFQDLLRNAEMMLAHQPIRVLFTDSSIQFCGLQHERHAILKRKASLFNYQRIFYLSSGKDWTHYFVNNWNGKLEIFTCTFDSELKFANYQMITESFLVTV